MIEESLTVPENHTFIVNGNLTARHITVRGNLCVTGDLFCQTLYGNSGNDYSTIIGGNLQAKEVIQYGHFTEVLGHINCELLVSTINEIIATNGINAGQELKNNILNKLKSDYLDENGYFSEEKFLMRLR